MTSSGLLLWLGATAAQSPAADSLRALAARLPESALVLETRARPLAVREAVAGALAGNDLTAAGQLAAAYAIAWRDSFLVREVVRFAAWPPDRRAAKLWVDSVRRTGITAYGRDGALAAITIWRRALSRALTIADTAGAAAALGNIGAGFLTEGRLDSAETDLERSRVLASGIGDIRVEANAVGTLAGVSGDRGDLAGARDGYVRALALRERIGDTRGVAADRNNLGLLAQHVGDQDEARRQFEAALALNRRDGRDEVAATNLVNLAGLSSQEGDFARAEAYYRDALATWRTHERWADAADALHGLGQLELRRGDYRAARTALLDALAIYDRTGPLASALAVRRELAAALAAAGELQGALDGLRRAEQLADSLKAPPGLQFRMLLTLVLSLLVWRSRIVIAARELLAIGPAGVVLLALIALVFIGPLAVALAARGVGAALAAGCPVVLRPSSLTPLAALCLAHALQDAGLPAGVLNVVTGTGQNVGAPLVGGAEPPSATRRSRSRGPQLRSRGAAPGPAR